MKPKVAVVLYLAVLVSIMFSCRRNRPTLVDSNRPPETELWYAPPESTETDYLVHMYWRGVDPDGVAQEYIWTITDTLVNGLQRWNPSQRTADFRAGRITTRTDSVFAFTAFRNISGAGVKKNRQAFHVAAIDDNGIIDPTPAAIEFIATVRTIPKLVFTTYFTRVQNGSRGESIRSYDPTQIDTIGMFRPFRISYHGETNNGTIREYKFLSLTSGIDLPGQDMWSDDLSDTLRVFTNAGADTLPSGRFRLAAQARDDAGAESRVDAGRFTEGVVEVVVNYEPDTKIVRVKNTYSIGGQNVTDLIDFEDDEPDTVPIHSWIELKYIGREHPGDSTRCTDVTNECLTYQVQYTSYADLRGGPSEPGGRLIDNRIAWSPNDPADTDDTAVSDTTSLNMGPQRYELRARAVDEYMKSDGTPPQVEIVANFPPTMDSYTIRNWDGTEIQDGDTLQWDWCFPANFTGDVIDTLQLQPILSARRQWFFTIEATGHDHPKEDDPINPNKGGVTAWSYGFVDDTGEVPGFGRGNSWVRPDQKNALSDTIKMEVIYPIVGPDADPGGYITFANRPRWLDRTYEFNIRGRDSWPVESFTQFMWLPVTSSTGTTMQKVNKDQYSMGQLGRLTAKGGYSFYLTLTHPSTGRAPCGQ